jgi:hypothetical protein
MERLFALEMVNRLEAHIQATLPKLSFAAARELRSEIEELMHQYRIVKKPEGYKFR